MEYRINDLSSFVKIITNDSREQFYHQTAHLQIVYRGQADKDWTLLPSAFRSKEDSLNENLYITECIREMPSKLLTNNYFDTLVMLQHYGVPTRLLDVTKNPLVALYFACNNKFDKDGCVIVFPPSAAFSQNDTFVDIITQYLFNLKCFDNWDERLMAQLLKLVNSIVRKYNPVTLESLEEFLINATTYLVFPNLTNERIKAQQGAFLIFSTALEKQINKNGITFKFKLPDESNCFPYTEKIIIPKEEKERILFDLSKIGINEAALFPDIEHQTKSIVENVKKYNKRITTRLK